MNRFILYCIVCLLLVGMLGCTPALENGATVAPSPGDANAIVQTMDEANADFDDASATHIVFSGSEIQIDGAGASASGTTLIIEDTGTYVLRGTLENGTVIVNAEKTDAVRLVLNGVEITSADGAAVQCITAEKLIVTLAQGTTNTCTDSETYTFESADVDEPNAAFFSKVDTFFNGTGSLAVNANYQHGILSKDNLTFYSGSYFVSAPQNGIRGRDSLVVYDGTFNIQAGNDGLQSNNPSGKESEGAITLYGGEYHITAAQDGIQAESTLTISGGQYNIVTGGGHTNTETTSSESYKGLKAQGDILIQGGTFSIDSADDTIHSNANVTIEAGTFELLSGDDGIHADASTTIYNGTVNIPACYEGIEGANIYIEGGIIHVVSSDDGINAAGGSDETGNGRFGMDQFQGGDHEIVVNGGTVTIDAKNGDGFDANGTITINGGELYVQGANNGADVAFDCDSTFLVNGGVVVGAGASGMLQLPAAASTQPTLMLYYNTQTPSAGTELSVRDEADNVLVRYTFERTAQCVLISSPQFEVGGTYSIYSGEIKLTDVTLEETTIQISDTGESVTGGMGGMGGMGGGRGPNGDARPEDGTWPGGTRPNGGTPPEGNFPAGGDGGTPPDPNTGAQEAPPAT
ncbi:carbohydrate-binding domain-containing protein [Christensenellaceae bacterium OttesenSCG-928-L17]|nr:carbohydrate-binding domain-containing protein [Christensenellaceae bacterium OttesenSCG-928-L17]